ncbi:interleukin-17 receptor E [Hoplias malabaricus]|uniref:interleukin-17 receptor E n=1 Tax=Hoplias malabaricus TaxID=27720 RepID=UPI0034631F42
MRATPVFARVLLLLALHAWLLSAALEHFTRKHVLTVKEGWSYVVETQNLPQLDLSNSLVDRGKVCVRVRLRAEPLLGRKTLRIVFNTSATSSSEILIWKSHENDSVWWKWTSKNHTWRAKIDSNSVMNKQHPAVPRTPVWELQYDCFKAKTDHRVIVSVRDTNLTLTSASYRPKEIHLRRRNVNDEVPRYTVRVDTTAKIFIVAMDSGQEVIARWCYKSYKPLPCKGTSGLKINTDLNSTVNLSFPHLVPCVCVQLYYTGIDARRNTTCPIMDKILPGGGDILSSSSLKLYGSSVLEWIPLCPSDPFKPTVSLCWQHHKNHSQCFPVQNSILLDQDRKYNVTSVDKHAHMCLKFSLHGGQRVFCPFSSDDFSEWEVTVVPGSWHLHIQVSSKISAVFSAQLCVEEDGAYVANGKIKSVQMKGGAREVDMKLPLHSLIPGLCVQVWRSKPSLNGKRIICPDYTHRRWGLVVVVSVAFLITLTTLGFLIYVLIKKKTSVWRCAQRKPVLLVCSSDDAAHVAAVCALASGLKEELLMDVRLAQWSLCSTPASLAKLGPAPWLYGQWQEVQRAGGMLLLVWSLDAQQAFLRWKEREGKKNIIGNEMKDVMCNYTQKKEGGTETSKDMSSVTAAVLNATLSCLCARLRSEHCSQNFGLVCFQNLGGSCIIPKELRGIRRFCLPQNLSNLIHELDLKETSPGSGNKEVPGGWCCWPRLFSKALSFWLSQKLAQRLEAWLPQTDSNQEREKCKLIVNLSQKPYDEKKNKF